VSLYAGIVCTYIRLIMCAGRVGVLLVSPGVAFHCKINDLTHIYTENLQQRNTGVEATRKVNQIFNRKCTDCLSFIPFEQSAHIFNFVAHADVNQFV